MYRCEFCGYASELLDDFEEDFLFHKGFWCPCCDGFTYFDKKNDHQNYRLIFEVKDKTTARNQKVAFPTQVSPLRWPGGKSKFIGPILDRCNPENMVCFVEPFAGGASVGLSLLLAGKIKEFYLNDLDFGIYALFQCIKDFPWMLIDKISMFEPCKKAFLQAQATLKNGYDNLDIIDAAWNLLIVNRLAFSGIPKANCMSNLSSRWNKNTLIKRILQIHGHSEHLHVSCTDACELIEEMYWRPNTTIFIDPPYKGKGKDLYMKYYENNDHNNLAFLLDELYKGMPGADMLLTYDNSDYIRQLYQYPEMEEIGRIYSIAN